MNSLRKRAEEKGCFSMQLIPPFPTKNMLIEVTNFCNHKCIFCANSKMNRKRGFIDSCFAYHILKEANELGVKEVGFYATGEPLMNPQIFDYVKKAKAIGYEYVYMTTNGVLLDEKKMEKITSSKLDSIKFSINAGKSETYRLIHGKDDFGKVIENVKKLSILRRKKNLKLSIFVSYVVTNINNDEKEELERLLKDYIDEIYFSNVGNQGGMMYEENKKLLVGDGFPRKTKCYLPFNSITISHEGYLSACCVDFQNYLIVADLNKCSLKEAWESDKFQKLRKMHMENRLGQTMCNNCINCVNETIIPL